MATILETTRIRLREFTERDLDTLATMVTDEGQMRFYPRPKTRDEASAWIRRNVRFYQEHGFGFWLMESTTTADFLGYCGIRRHDELHDIEMGWHTMKTYWNQGFATEAALASRDLAFSRFALERLIGVVDPKNVASIRVAEKIGMRPERKTVLEGDAWIIYAIHRSAT